MGPIGICCPPTVVNPVAFGAAQAGSSVQHAEVRLRDAAQSTEGGEGGGSGSENRSKRRIRHTERKILEAPRRRIDGWG